MILGPGTAEEIMREIADRDRRIDAALALHAPQQICVAHHINDHDCPEPQGVIYRCFSCRSTSVAPCKTWKALTGKDKPDA